MKEKVEEGLIPEESEEESEEYRIAKGNRRRRQKADRNRMGMSGRSVFTIQEIEKKRAEDLEQQDEARPKRPYRKSRTGRR